MERVSVEDWDVIHDLARRYCRKVDATRTRKRMDGSATVVRDGYAPYGTDDISDDVTQDAVLMYARRLRDICATCERTHDDDGIPGWTYVKRNGQTMFVTGETLRYWAVRDAAARNGYRLDVDLASDGTETPVHGRSTRAEPMSPSLAASQVAQQSEAIFVAAWGDGSEFPTLGRCMAVADGADHLGHAGVLSHVAQDRYGGVYGAHRPVRKVREAAKYEWRELSARLDEVRDQMFYRGSQTSDTD
jgi:galactarate dehydratase